MVACHNNGQDIIGFTDEAGDLIDAQGNPKTSYEWNGETAGITKDGMMIGTYPVIGLGSSSTQSNATTDAVTSSEPEKPSADVLFEIKDANALADEIRSIYSDLLTTDTLSGWGRKSRELEMIRIEVDRDGYWSLEGINPDYYDTVSGEGHHWKWEASAKGINALSGRSDNMTANMLFHLAKRFPDLRNCAMCLGIKDLACSFIAFSYDITDADRLMEITNEMNINFDGVGNTYVWDGKTPGLTKDGMVIGTDPIVELS